MIKGQNLAIKSRNLWESSANMGTDDNICIFLSHKSEDKDYVRAIGEHIMNSGIDIYLDENDFELQMASQKNDAKKVTACIEKGIEESSHILCLVSDKTRKSWWVPYELGYGKSSQKDLCIIKRKGSEKLPDYLAIEKQVTRGIELDNYLNKIHREYGRVLNENKIFDSTGYKTISKTAGAYTHPLKDYLE